MNRFLICFAVLVLTLTQGCGTWCNKNHEYCVEGFSGFTRYQNYNSVYYYPVTVFTIANDLKNDNCFINIIIDGIVMGSGIKAGEFKRIEIKSPPNENRPATVLIKRYCSGKPKGSYTNRIQLSSTQPAPYSWVIDERYFPGWK